jgi:hypothetical protein
VICCFFGQRMLTVIKDHVLLFYVSCDIRRYVAEIDTTTLLLDLGFCSPW